MFNVIVHIRRRYELAPTVTHYKRFDTYRQLLRYLQRIDGESLYVSRIPLPGNTEIERSELVYLALDPTSQRCAIAMAALKERIIHDS